MGSCCEMKGYLSFLVLMLISKNPMSGEEIRQEIAKRKGAKPSSGTIYPVLKTLSEGGLIEEIKESGKEKRYQLTKRGQKEIKTATEKFCCIFADLRDEFKKH